MVRLRSKAHWEKWPRCGGRGGTQAAWAGIQGSCRPASLAARDLGAAATPTPAPARGHCCLTPAWRVTSAPPAGPAFPEAQLWNRGLWPAPCGLELVIVGARQWFLVD